MEQNIKIIGCLHIALHMASLLIAALFLGIGVFAGHMMSQMTANMPGMPNPATFFTSFFGLFALFVLLLSLPGMVVGWGLVHRKAWARTAGIVVSFLDLLNPPFVMALGIYGLVVLLNPDSAYLFQ